MYFTIFTIVDSGKLDYIRHFGRVGVLMQRINILSDVPVKIEKKGNLGKN
jgi:hypothetical protein